MIRWLVLILVVGCSGPSTPEHGDAPVSPDGGGPESCAQTAPGTVHVHDVSGTLLTHDASGAFVHRIDLATQQTVDVTVPPCGAITLVNPTHTFFNTTTSLVDGDDIYIFHGTPPNPTAPLPVVVDTQLPNVNNYMATSDCGFAQGSSTIEIQYATNCVDPDGRGTVLVIPYIAQMTPLAYALFENIVVADTPSAPLHVTAWRTDAPHHQFSWALEAAARSVSCSAGSMRGSHGYIGRGAYTADPAASSLDLQFPEFGDGHIYTCLIQTDLSARGRGVTAPGVALPAAVALHEADLLPSVASVPPLDGDGMRPSISFGLGPDRTEEDAVRVELFGTSVTGAPAGWEVFAPPGTRTVRIPEAPADIAPSFVDTSLSLIGLYDAADTTSYREVVQDTDRITGRAAAGVPGAFRYTEWRPF